MVWMRSFNNAVANSGDGVRQVGGEDGSLVESDKKKGRVFKDPVNDDSIQVMSRKVFAPQSRKKMKWAMNLYSEWRANRIGNPGVSSCIVNANLDRFDSFTKGELAYSLCRFVREVRKLNGTENPPNTIREIVVMIQMFLHQNGINWKLLEGDEFLSLRNVVDNTMKERHALGMGVKNSSEVISLAHEDKLFKSGVLEIPMQLNSFKPLSTCLV